MIIFNREIIILQLFLFLTLIYARFIYRNLELHDDLRDTEAENRQLKDVIRILKEQYVLLR